MALMKIIITGERLNVLYERNWTRLVRAELRRFETSVVSAAKLDGYDGKTLGDAGRQWSFSGALLYSVTVITTIGYGNLAPRTPGGKVATMLYALLGVPLMLLCLSNLGSLLAHTFQFAYSHARCFASPAPPRTQNRLQTVLTPDVRRLLTECAEYSLAQEGTEADPSAVRVLRELHEDKEEDMENEPSPAERVPVSIVLLVLTGYICLGAAVFAAWEDWSFLDGAYFCFITLSTIGFGDLVPGKALQQTDTRGGQLQLVACCAYLLLGLVLLAMSFSLVQEGVVAKCRQAALTLGILKQTGK